MDLSDSIKWYLEPSFPMNLGHPSHPPIKATMSSLPVSITTAPIAVSYYGSPSISTSTACYAYSTCGYPCCNMHYQQPPPESSAPYHQQPYTPTISLGPFRNNQPVPQTPNTSFPPILKPTIPNTSLRRTQNPPSTASVRAAASADNMSGIQATINSTEQTLDEMAKQLAAFQARYGLSSPPYSQNSSSYQSPVSFTSYHLPQPSPLSRPSIGPSAVPVSGYHTFSESTTHQQFCASPYSLGVSSYPVSIFHPHTSTHYQPTPPCFQAAKTFRPNYQPPFTQISYTLSPSQGISFQSSTNISSNSVLHSFTNGSLYIPHGHSIHSPNPDLFNSQTFISPATSNDCSTIVSPQVGIPTVPQTPPRHLSVESWVAEEKLLVQVALTSRSPTNIVQNGSNESGDVSASVAGLAFRTDTPSTPLEDVVEATRHSDKALCSFGCPSKQPSIVPTPAVYDKILSQLENDVVGITEATTTSSIVSANNHGLNELSCGSVTDTEFLDAEFVVFGAEEPVLVCQEANESLSFVVEGICVPSKMKTVEAFNVLEKMSDHEAKFSNDEKAMSSVIKSLTEPQNCGVELIGTKLEVVKIAKDTEMLKLMVPLSRQQYNVRDMAARNFGTYWDLRDEHLEADSSEQDFTMKLIDNDEQKVSVKVLASTLQSKKKTRNQQEPVMTVASVAVPHASGEKVAWKDLPTYPPPGRNSEQLTNNDQYVVSSCPFIFLNFHFYEQMVNLKSAEVVCHGRSMQKNIELGNYLVPLSTSPCKNMVSWHSTNFGYTQHGEALHLFQLMQSSCEGPDKCMHVTTLSACSQLGAFVFEKWICYIVKDLSHFRAIFGTALVGMHAAVTKQLKYVASSFPTLAQGTTRPPLVNPLWAYVWENMSFHLEKNEDEFRHHLNDFTLAAWNLLTTFSQTSSLDRIIVVTLKFFTIVTTCFHPCLIEMETEKHQIFQSIVCPHVLLRKHESIRDSVEEDYVGIVGVFRKCKHVHGTTDHNEQLLYHPRGVTDLKAHINLHTLEIFWNIISTLASSQEDSGTVVQVGVATEIEPKKLMYIGRRICCFASGIIGPATMVDIYKQIISLHATKDYFVVGFCWGLLEVALVEEIMKGIFFEVCDVVLHVNTICIEGARVFSTAKGIIFAFQIPAKPRLLESGRGIHTPNKNVPVDVVLELVSTGTTSYVGVYYTALGTLTALPCICAKRGVIDFKDMDIDAKVLNHIVVTSDHCQTISLQLQDTIQCPVDHPKQFEQFGITYSKGDLFSALLGCSMTFHAQSVVDECSANLVIVLGPDLLSIWFGGNQEIRKVDGVKKHDTITSVVCLIQSGGTSLEKPCSNFLSPSRHPDTHMADIIGKIYFVGVLTSKYFMLLSRIVISLQ